MHMVCAADTLCDWDPDAITTMSQVLLNLAASHTSSHAVRDAGIAMVLQSLIHSVTQVRPPSVPSTWLVICLRMCTTHLVCHLCGGLQQACMSRPVV